MEDRMDLRIQKTEKAIKNAFLELRAKKSLEKITVKELCTLACINKSTFYSHYEDIYALSETIEQDTVESIINSISRLEEYTPGDSEIFTREICLAFLSQINLIRILFSGREQSHLGIRLDEEIKKKIFRKYPEYKKDPAKQVLLSFCIQGTYHSYLNNSSVNNDIFVKTIEQVATCLKPLLE